MPPTPAARNSLTPEQQRALDKAMGETLKLRDATALEQCLAAGANPAAVIRIWENGNSVDFPAFIYAAHEGGLAKTGRIFLSYGVDVNMRDARGQTALMRSVAGKHTEDIRFLLESGADVNLQDEEGDAALVIGLRAGLSAGQIQLLLEAGADVLAQNKKGEVALERALSTSVFHEDRNKTILRSMIAKLPPLKKDFAKAADVSVKTATEIRAPHIKVGPRKGGHPAP